jgi:Fe2+ or Zn2+ uptake regulation protein
MSSVSLSVVHEAAKRRFAEAGQMYTTGRRELVELLYSLGRPVTPQEVLDSRPKLTQSSVYRNLAVLEEMQVVQRVAGADDRARVELAEDIIGHHHHLVCLICGRVDDLVISPKAERTIDTVFDQAVEGTGFVATGHRLDILGTCKRCA